MKLFLLASLLALPIVACTAADGASSSSEDVVFHPSGPGADVVLTLKVPDFLWPARYFYGSGTEIFPNTETHLPVVATPDGYTAFKILVSGGPPGKSLMAQAMVKIPTGKTTLELGAMRLIHSAPISASMLTLDPVQPVGTLTYDQPGGGAVTIWTQENGDAPTLDFYSNEPIVPTFPGHYLFSSRDGVNRSEFDVVAGQRIDANLAEPSYISNVTIAADPTPAEFLNAIGDKQPFTVSCAYGAPPQSGASQQAFAGWTVSVYAMNDAACSWGYGKAQVPFALPRGSSFVAQLKHLDVDDVDVTDAPGQKASGTYVITLPDGTPVTTQPYPTKTSIDLPPGTYTITTTYLGADNFQRQTTGTVTL